MLEPQSPALFVLLVVIFGVLMWRGVGARRAALRLLPARLAVAPALVFGVRRWRVLVPRRAAFRILAACLAFAPAMVFGVLAVNKYYDYYQTWGSMTADLTQQSAGAASGVPDVKLAGHSRS